RRLHGRAGILRPTVDGMTPRTLTPEPQPTLLDRPVGLIRLSSPIGRIELCSDGISITGLSIESDGSLPRDGYRQSSTDLPVRAAGQLSAYFPGTRRRFDLPVHVEGPRFQRRVWSALGEVGYGTSTTYGLLGHQAGLG